MKTFNATQLNTIMQAGYKNQRKGALQTVLSNAALTLVKGEALTNEEIKENLVSEKALNDSPSALKKAVQRRVNDSKTIADQMAFLPESVGKAIAELYNATSVADFDKAVEKLLKTMPFMAGYVLENATDVLKMFDFYGIKGNGYNADGFNYQGFDSDGYNAAGFDASGFNKDGLNADGISADDVAKQQADLKAKEDAQKKADEHTKEQQRKELDRMRELAEKAVNAMLNDLPQLDAVYKVAAQADSVELALFQLASGFSAEYEKLKAEKLALENELEAKKPLAKVA